MNEAHNVQIEARPAFGASLSNAGLGIHSIPVVILNRDITHIVGGEKFYFPSGTALYIKQTCVEQELKSWKDSAANWDCSTPEELKERIFALPEIY